VRLRGIDWELGFGYASLTTTRGLCGPYFQAVNNDALTSQRSLDVSENTPLMGKVSRAFAEDALQRELVVCRRHHPAARSFTGCG
jgi:hypothetical protein